MLIYLNWREPLFLNLVACILLLLHFLRQEFLDSLAFGFALCRFEKLPVMLDVLASHEASRNLRVFP